MLEVERFDGDRWAEATTLSGEGLNAPAAALLDGLVVGGSTTAGSSHASPGSPVVERLAA